MIINHPQAKSIFHTENPLRLKITVNHEIFVVKIFSDRLISTKIIKRTKIVCIINANAVRGRLSENYFTQKFIAWNIYDMKYSRFTVISIHHYGFYLWDLNCDAWAIISNQSLWLLIHDTAHASQFRSFNYFCISPSMALHACGAGRGECSCGACVCSSSTLDDSAAAPYRGPGCECPPEEICLNPEDGVRIVLATGMKAMHYPIVMVTLSFQYI
jgi:hypothetical protein